MPDSNLPSRIDRAAIERIIQRATELQTGERDISDGLSPEEVVALGKDVGIPEQYLKQAMLEEHGRQDLPAPTGMLDRVLAGAMITSQRVVRGEVAEIEHRLLAWMDNQELLTVQRQQPGRIAWEPLAGVQSALRRSAAALGGRKPFMLTSASLVTATVTALEPGFCHVSLLADLRSTRSGYVGGIAALSGVGAVSAGVLLVMSPFWVVAVAPVVLAGGAAYAVSRQFRPLAERAQLGLERALDHLDRGDVKPSHALPPRGGGVVGAFLDEVRKALNP
jgi:hypothetical protein